MERIKGVYEMTAYKAIRQYCIECMNGNAQEVKNCIDTNCRWYPYRFKCQPGSRIKQIRQFCLYDCVGIEESDRAKQVLNCKPNKKCALWDFRLGRNDSLKAK